VLLPALHLRSQVRLRRYLRLQRPGASLTPPITLRPEPPRLRTDR
jgi:hypothetical protein